MACQRLAQVWPISTPPAPPRSSVSNSLTKSKRVSDKPRPGLFDSAPEETIDREQAESLAKKLRALVPQAAELVATCRPAMTPYRTYSGNPDETAHERAVRIVPDRDADGMAGAEKTAARLYGVATSVSLVALPAEVAGKDGADVRDILAKPDGERLVKQAIEDAAEWTPPKADSDQKPRRTPKVLDATKWLADRIRKKDTFAQDDGGKLYRYHAGCYRERADEFIRRRVQPILAETPVIKWSRRVAEEVVEYIRVGSPTLWERPPIDLLNLANRLLDVRNRKLKPHNADYLSAVQLPVRYVPDATCPDTDQFAADVLPEDCIETAWRIVAWLMLPHVHVQKAVLLIGEGGNGKSTWLAQVRAFLGKRNTCAASLHKLEANRFTVARLVGKLANICPDLPASDLENTSVFKALTDFTDPLEAEIKFGRQFDCRPFARLVFSANQMPRSNDSSSGFFDRWLVLPFDRRFRGEKNEIRRDVLDARLSDPLELSGLLNRALELLPAVQQNGLGEPPSAKQAARDFRQATDPLAVWLEQYTEYDAMAATPKWQVRKAFNQDCQAHNRQAMGEREFGLRFGALMPHVQTAQRTVNGKREWCYIGLALTEELR